MKQFFNISNLIMFLLFFSAAINCGQLSLAIKRLDIKEVKRLLDGKGSISKSHQNKLLAFAKKSINKKGKFTFALSRSKSDIQRIVLGSISTLIGGCGIYFGGLSFYTGWRGKSNLKSKYDHIPKNELSEEQEKAIEKDSARWKKQFLLSSILNFLGCTLTAYGIKQMYRGWNLYGAFLILKQAHEIKNLIKNCPISKSNKKETSIEKCCVKNH